MAPDSESLSPHVLREMITNVDQKLEEGHRRLRQDLAKGLSEVNTEVEKLWDEVTRSKIALAVIKGADNTSRRYSVAGIAILSSVISSLIGGGFALLIWILTNRKP